MGGFEEDTGSRKKREFLDDGGIFPHEIRTGRSHLTEKKTAIMVVFTCRDIGMDCSFEMTGTTDTGIMKKFIDHAGSAHTMSVLTADVIFKVKKAIKKEIKSRNSDHLGGDVGNQAPVPYPWGDR
jgi:predicted small metal-binding protein